jgi:N-methyl-L-proline demethylase
VRREGPRLAATLGSDHAARRTERVVDHVITELGTYANDELYLSLVPGARNGGEVDHAALIAVRPQRVIRNPDGAYQLFRIGDAVSARNVHAAVYDALRLCAPL